MHVVSACLRFGLPVLFLAGLVACQASPNVVQPTPAPGPTAEPTRAAPVKVSVEAVKDQVVLVDQVGYLATYPKIALVSDANATSFQLVDSKTQLAVFEGKLGEATRDADSGQVVRRADFSPVTA